MFYLLQSARFVPRGGIQKLVPFFFPAIFNTTADTGHFLSGWLVMALPYHERKTVNMVTLSFMQDPTGDVQVNSSGMVFKPYDIECIQQAYAILSKDPPPKITNEALALEVGINRNKLHYGFKHVYGITIAHYLEQRRMQRAELLLSTTYKSVKTIAALTGYCNSSRFVAVFKKTFGITPYQYRKQCRLARHQAF